MVRPAAAPDRKTRGASEPAAGPAFVTGPIRRTPPTMASMPCPICGKPVSKAEGERPADFPFCSERCRLLDLGKWLGGAYRISTPIESPEQLEELLEDGEEPSTGDRTPPDTES